MSGNRNNLFIFFSSLPTLVSVAPHPSISFSLASSVCPYPRFPQVTVSGPPRREGGSRAQSRGYPPACEGRWGYVTSGAGPRAVGTERGRWSDWEMSDTCSTHRSRVPRRRLGGYKRGATTVKDERGPGLGFILWFGFCLCAAVDREGLSRCFVFILSLKFYLSVRRFPPPSSRHYGVFILLHWCRNPGGRRDALPKIPCRWGESAVPSSRA